MSITSACCLFHLSLHVSHIAIGDVARVNGQLAVSRAFGDKNLKSHLRSDPDIKNADIDSDSDILILASDGLWKVVPLLLQLSLCFASPFLFMIDFMLLIMKSKFNATHLMFLFFISIICVRFRSCLTKRQSIWRERPKIHKRRQSSYQPRH